MTLEQAKMRAEKESKKGYVQHVNRTCDSSDLRAMAEGRYSYTVSDWYDSARTVASYENGKEK